MTVRLILASASPARLQTLRRAGVRPEVVVSGVDESLVSRETSADLVLALAELKGQAVLDLLSPTDDVIVVACDSMLELDGQSFGKPDDAAEAVARWRTMRGRDGILHTGHWVVIRQHGRDRVAARVASTTVTFADLDDAEIDAYVATGEPLWVAGAFTLDGLGGPYVTRIDGDPHNVVGISLPLLRVMLRDLGVPWHDLVERV